MFYINETDFAPRKNIVKEKKVVNSRSHWHFWHISFDF